MLRVATVVLASFLGLWALAGSPEAHGLSPERTYMGPLESGGLIRLTINPEDNGLSRLELMNHRLRLRCGFAPSDPPSGPGLDIIFYFDPPRSLAGGTFSFGAFLGTPHSPATYSVKGTVAEDGSLSGTARRGGNFDCDGSQTDPWSASAVSSEPPGRSDPVYGDPAGSIVLTTNPKGDGLTSLQLSGFDGLECYGEANIRAFFEPAVPVTPPDDSPSTRFIVIRSDVAGPRSLMFISLNNARTEAGNLELTLKAASLGGGCDSEPVELIRVRPPETVRSPTAQSPNVLPKAGSVEPTHNTFAITWLVFALVGGVIGTAGLLLRRVKH